MNSHYVTYACPICWEETEVVVYPPVRGRTNARFEDCIQPEPASSTPELCPHCDSEISQEFIENEFD